MNNRTKTILLVLLFILIPAACGIGFWLIRRKKDNAAPDSANEAEQETALSTAIANSTVNTNSEFPLSYNPSVKSVKVKEIQAALNKKIDGALPPTCPYADNKPVTSLVEDGYYGKKTAAVIKFLWPDTDGKTFTQEMYSELMYTTKSYRLF